MSKHPYGRGFGVSTSRYKAFTPEGVFKEIVTLTADAKRRYELKGWTFERTLVSDWTG